jgi:hypothetical protein
MKIRSTALALIILGSIFASCGKKDQNPPVLTLKGDATMSIYNGESFSDPGASAVDDKDGDISSKIRIEGTVVPVHAGQYTLTYKAADKAGNEATPVSRTVNVKHKNTNIAGDYSVSESCTGSAGPYNVGPYDASVTASPDNVTGVVMKNFGNFNTTIDLTAGLSDVTNQTITLTANQVVAGVAYSGSGTVDAAGRVLVINYTQVQGTSQDQCTATWTRK